ncbi:MAG: MBL fold metallo-hydrolase [Candidatus Micrarchaeia archaeon]
MKITIVYDNEAEEGLKSGWGFSCLIEGRKKVLFDTGADGPTLISNMEKLNIEPASIDVVVLSHPHGDHTGGLRGLLEKAGKPEIYAPFELDIPNFHFVSDVAEICNGISAHSLGFEQYLLLEISRGLLIIGGCSHPGLGNMIDDASGFGEVYGVLGGFHGFSELDKLETIRFIAPCHCTAKKQEILQRFSQAEECAAGKIFEIP